MNLPAQFKEPPVPRVCLSFLGSLTWAAVCSFAIPLDSTCAQDAPRWKVGTTFHQQLQEPIDSFEWRDRPLRGGLTRSSQTYGVAVFLDRRIDPDQPLTISAHARPLEDTLRAIAHEAKAEMAFL